MISTYSIWLPSKLKNLFVAEALLRVSINALSTVVSHRSTRVIDRNLQDQIDLLVRQEQLLGGCYSDQISINGIVLDV
jgi:hypothetical protein